MYFKCIYCCFHLVCDSEDHDVLLLVMAVMEVLNNILQYVKKKKMLKTKINK